MKQLYKTLVLFFIFSSYAFAQDTTKTKPCKWGVGVQMNSLDDDFPPFVYLQDWNNSMLVQGNKKETLLAGGILGFYTFKNKETALRIKIGISDIKVHNNTNQPIHDPGVVDLQIWDVTIKQRSEHLSLGIQWMNTNHRLNYLGGFELIAAKFGNYSVDYTIDTYSNNVLTSTGKDLSIIPGGYSAGIGSFFGVKYNCIKNLYIGSECSGAFAYSTIGGQIVTDNIPETNESGYKKIEKFAFTKPVFSINISYWFGK